MNRRKILAAIASTAASAAASTSMIGQVSAQSASRVVSPRAQGASPAASRVVTAAVPVSPAANLGADVEAFIDEMVSRHQFERDALRVLFARVRTQTQVLAAMQSQYKPRPWFDYRPAFVNRPRITGGVRFWQDNSAALERAQASFGVPAEVVVATIAAETLFGRMMGTHPVLDSLASLAFEFPRRAEFFRSELEQFLLLARELSIDPAQPRGSFAGAMGIPQFMPSSYRKFAVDFDGDGRTDLFRNAADAIGSVANYYRVFGWVTEGPVTVRASGPVEVAESQAKLGIKPHTTVGALSELGIVPMVDIPASQPAMVFPLITREGTEYWLGFDNFFVITRYNRAVHYAMAVHELSREIRMLHAATPARP